MPYTKEQLRAQVAKLPEALKDALFSVGSAEIIQKIGTKYQLHIDEVGEVASETGLVMMGLTPPDKFVDNLRGRLARIPETTVRNITADINTQIFSGVRELIKNLYGGGTPLGTPLPVSIPRVSAPVPLGTLLPATTTPKPPPPPPYSRRGTEGGVVVAPSTTFRISPQPIPARPTTTFSPIPKPPQVPQPVPRTPPPTPANLPTGSFIPRPQLSASLDGMAKKSDFAPRMSPPPPPVRPTALPPTPSVRSSFVPPVPSRLAQKTPVPPPSLPATTPPKPPPSPPYSRRGAEGGAAAGSPVSPPPLPRPAPLIPPPVAQLPKPPPSPLITDRLTQTVGLEKDRKEFRLVDPYREPLD